MSRVKSGFHTFKVAACAVFLACVVFYSLANMNKAPSWSAPAGSTSSATASPHHR